MAELRQEPFDPIQHHVDAAGMQRGQAQEDAIAADGDGAQTPCPLPPWPLALCVLTALAPLPDRTRSAVMVCGSTRALGRGRLSRRWMMFETAPRSSWRWTTMSTMP